MPLTRNETGTVPPRCEVKKPMMLTSHSVGRETFVASVMSSPWARFLPVALENIRFDAGFWLDQQQRSHSISLHYAYRMFEQGGNFRNFRLAARLEQGEYTRRLASDSDVYKWLEAIGFELARGNDEALRSMAESVIDWIEAAQDDDGYLMTYYQVLEPHNRWTDLANGHELYCAGHLIQAAVAYDSATHDGRLTQIAHRLVEHIASIFGPDKRHGTGGHPEIELALVEFYRRTGQRKCLELAEFFVDQRGRKAFGLRDESRFQNHRPVRSQRTVEGHAVRQLYLCAGVTDLFLETGEQDLLETVDAQWRDMVERKLYVTGGAGQRYDGEVFGEAYELPPDRCYCETCAAVASVFWNWRMLLATGEARFADLIERTLYNAFLASYGQDGEHFFYVNPLQSRGPSEHRDGDTRGGWRRAHWHGTACCPPNVMRLLASLDQYFVTYRGDELQIQQYGSMEIQHTVQGTPVLVRMETEYPWRGTVSLTVKNSCSSAWTMAVRIPGWCGSANVTVNGQRVSAETSDGYVRIRRVWVSEDVVKLDLSMCSVWIEAHPSVDSVRGCLALQRGPLVYCFEQCDLDESLRLEDMKVEAHMPISEQWRDDIVGGVMALQVSGKSVGCEAWKGQLYRTCKGYSQKTADSIRMTAIPYYAWANRSSGAMRVWIPVEAKVE